MNPSASILRSFSAFLLFAASLSAAHGESAFHDRHVLVIGIDGCRPDSILPADAPNLHRLIEKGVVTYDAFAGGVQGTPSLQRTSSGPGWSSIFTGVWIDKHGVSNNDFTGDHFDQYPHFFQRVKEVAPTAYLSSIVSWNPIDTEIVAAVDAYTDFRGKGVGGDEVVRDRWVRDTTVEHLATEDPDILCLHFDEVDGAGHGNGYGKHISAYLEGIANVDAKIGDVLQAIENRPNRDQEDWLVIVTTDHGGLGSSHGGQSADERDIFVIVSGDTTSGILSERKAGHTTIPWTACEYLGIAVDEAWGWEEPAFGLPPYPPTQLEVVSGLRRDQVIRWQPPVDLQAEQLVLKRNGRAIASLPIDATQFVDVIPAGFFALQIVYTLEVEGADKAIEPLRVEVTLPKDLKDELVLHWPLAGDAQDISGHEHHGTLSSETTTEAGAHGGLGLHLAGPITTPLVDDLKFERFTDFSLGFWVRETRGAAGVLLANKPIGKSVGEGWVLSITNNGQIQWNMGDGIRQVTLTAPNFLSGGDWHHLGIGVDRLQKVTLYADGEALATQSVESLRSSDGPGPLALGSDPQGQSPLSIHVDDVRVWRRLLEQSDWSQLVEQRAVASAWRANQFAFDVRLNPDIGTWDADPDRDGRPNLAEFALGSLPQEADFQPLLRMVNDTLAWSQRTGGSGDPVMGYARQGVVMRLEHSRDLLPDTWQPVTDDDGEIVSISYALDGTHTVFWKPRQDDATPQRHFRVHYLLDRQYDQ